MRKECLNLGIGWRVWQEIYRRSPEHPECQKYGNALKKKISKNKKHNDGNMSKVKCNSPHLKCSQLIVTSFQRGTGWKLREKSPFKVEKPGTSLALQWLGLCAFTAELGTRNAQGVQHGQENIWQIGLSTSGKWSRLTSREKSHVDRIFLWYDVMRMTFYVYGFLPPNHKPQDLHGGSVVKNLPAKVGDTDSIPGPGGFYMPRMHLNSWATATGPVL